MRLFLDTSALVKLYVAEPGSLELRQQCTGAEILVSCLAYGEAYATFWRLIREGLLSPAGYETLRHTFEADWTSVTTIYLSEEVLAHVPELCSRHPLRGADALQLACAMEMVWTGVSLSFVASDQRLLQAAAAEGLECFDPS
ncbi:MAG: type II toxin-antitoxin system VapC family toxin [Acidobacteria bacterium]|nr:type II toxin-antitoxin system VapC family toxin [Acidobacteriota bacterium]